MAKGHSLVMSYNIMMLSKWKQNEIIKKTSWYIHVVTRYMRHCKEKKTKPVQTSYFQIKDKLYHHVYYAVFRNERQHVQWNVFTINVHEIWDTNDRLHDIYTGWMKIMGFLVNTHGEGHKGSWLAKKIRCLKMAMSEIHFSYH